MFKLQSETTGEQTAFIDEMIGNQKVVDAYAHGEFRYSVGTVPFVGLIHGILHAYRRSHGVGCMVLVFRRSAEDCQNTVAEKLDDESVVPSVIRVR